MNINLAVLVIGGIFVLTVIFGIVIMIKDYLRVKQGKIISDKYHDIKEVICGITAMFLLVSIPSACVYTIVYIIYLLSKVVVII